MSFGASNLELPTAPGVAPIIKPGSELMGANPYSIKRACPLRSMMAFACYHRVSMITQPRATLKRISTLQWQRLKYGRGIRETTYPLQISMRDIKRMKVFQPLRDAEQLPYVTKASY